jgi:hypothetical protein
VLVDAHKRHSGPRPGASGQAHALITNGANVQFGSFEEIERCTLVRHLDSLFANVYGCAFSRRFLQRFDDQRNILWSQALYDCARDRKNKFVGDAHFSPRDDAKPAFCTQNKSA